jgi:multicomponent Na+:H+ antiporter subunit D
MIEPLPLVVMLPLTGAVAALLLRGRALTPVAAIATLATSGAAMALALQVAEAGTQTHAIGGWGAPLGIELRSDGLGALMVLMTAVVASIVGLYAHTYFPPRAQPEAVVGPSPWTERAAFWPLWLFLWGGLNALFVSADIFNLYVTLELVTLSGVALMVLGGGTDALTAGMRYLLAAVLGSMAYLLGVALLYAEFDSLDLATLGETASGTPSALVAVALMAAGLILKTALFPVHFWLPRAHANAPAPVSAALSALVVAGSFYALLRVWFDVAPAVPTVEAAHLLGLLGAAAIVWGSLQAIRARRLKMLVAHSTVAQVGYLFLLVPLTAVAGGTTGGSVASAQAAADAWNGGIYYVLAHAFAKAAMFLAAGTVMMSLGHDRVDDLRGLATRLPMTVLAFGVAGTSLIGLPPTGGFVAKYLLLDAAVTTGQWFYAVVILGGGLMTAGYVFRVISVAFGRADPGASLPGAFVRAPWVLGATPLLLALMALTLGLGATPPLDLLAIGAPFPAVAGPGD